MEYDFGLILLVSKAEVMINRDSWGRLYSVARGEILGFTEDKLLRKHSARMFSLIKNESWGIEDDQIPS